MRILIVEDEVEIAELIRAALEACGHVCRIARSAAAANLALADADHAGTDVDGITLDLGMPDRRGLDWLEELADTRPELARRTLVVTGAVLQPPEVERVAACGAGVLIKPFEVAGLDQAIRSQLGAVDGENPTVR